MTPLDRAERLRGAARENPDAVDPNEVLELLRHPARPVQRAAADALLPIVTEYPESGTAAVGRLAHLLRTVDRGDDDVDEAFGEALLLCVGRVATADPAKSLDAADPVLSLAAPAGPLASPASATLAQLVAARPGAFIHDVDQFGALLTSQEQAVRRHGAHVLVELGQEEPAALRAAVPQLRRCLSDEDTQTAQKAAVGVGQVARVDAAAVRPVLPALADALEAGPTSVRANAVGALADVAVDRPEAVDAYQDTLTPRLGDDAASVRRNTAVALGRLAEAGIDISSPAYAGLVELLDDSDTTVRATACQVFGRLSSPVAAQLLKTTADEDEAVAVRRAAERALQD